MDSIKTEDVIKDSNNAISQIAVSELFDGRYFSYLPIKEAIDGEKANCRSL